MHTGLLTHPALKGRVEPASQCLDIVYHAELGVDEHIDTIYRENDMDPMAAHVLPEDRSVRLEDRDIAGSRGQDTAERPETFVLFQQGAMEQRIVHDEERVEQRRQEREQEALAQRYAVYAQGNDNPITFAQFLDVMRGLRG